MRTLDAITYSLLMGSLLWPMACNFGKSSTSRRTGSQVAANTSDVSGDGDQNAAVEDKAEGDEPDDDLDSEEAVRPINVLGSFLADYDNSRIQCDYKRSGDRTYTSSCLVVVQTTDGAEVPASRIKDGVTLDWQDPSLQRGAARFEPCKEAANGLSLVCQLNTGQDDTAEFQFALEVSEADRAKRRETANIVLPYGVGVVAGLVPSGPVN